MAADPRPDIIVAVDLGTTFTGVGWARPQAQNALQSPIQVIHNWPGCSTRNEQKVHTCLVYGKDEKPSSWGFLCEDDDETDARRREFFKIFLDKMNLLEAQIKGLQGAPDSVEQAQKFVADYLREVYIHVKSTIEHQTGIGPFTGWKDLAVEFVFSVPTTWRSFEVINTFKAAVKDAGFGTEGPNHTSTVELTESEAAAVATLKSTAVNFEKDDIFLTVDAGGGTTDFALMQVMDAREPFPTLKQLTQVDGVGIGSTLIDRAFLELVEDRIFPFSDLAEQLPPDCIEKLVRSEKFKTTKHKFGEKVYNASVYRMPMEGMGYKFNHEGAGIESGRFKVTKEEMQSLFDPHIKSMLKKVREQLELVQLKAFGNPQVKFLILSGGLGSSAYVRDCLQQDLKVNPHPNAANIKIISATDPQLVVVRGLLLDRLQKLDSGMKPVLATRKARASYGVMCKMKYNPEVHFQEELKKDPLDGETYAMSQIDWLIKKGDDIDPNKPIISAFSQKIEKGSSVRHWDSVVVISHSEVDFLPVSMKDSGAKQLCTVRSDLSSIPDSELDPKRQSRGVFTRGKRWFNCSYEVRATVGPADLTFELWYKGKKFSNGHAPIKVTWDEEGAASAPTETSRTAAGTAAGTTAGTPAETASESGSTSDRSPAGSVSGLSSEGNSDSSPTPTSSLEEYVDVAAALGLNQRKRVMSEPPRFSLVVEDTTKTGGGDAEPKSEIPKVVVSTPPSEPPSLVVHRASEDLVRPEPPRADKGKRVMSLPPGGMADRILTYTDTRETRPMVRGGRVLKMPPKLSGERGRVRWSDVPEYWRHGAIDPLRCHSVDRLPPPSWQSG